MTSIKRLAEWSLSNAPEFRDPLAVRQARLISLDSIGCMIAGRRSPTARSIVELVADFGGRPDCTVVGAGFRTNAPNAVLANGVLVRALDLNEVMFIEKDGHLGVGGHCSDTYPVALAIAEMTGATWSDTFETLVMGFEMFARLREVMPPSSSWDGASSCGLVAAAMTGRLMKLDAEAQAHALAFSATRCATPKVVRWGELTSIKNIAGALVAESAVRGAMMAARGLTGPLEALDHRGGLHQVFDPRLDFSRLWAPASGPPRILLSHVKTWPCIGTGQTAVGAAIELHPKLAGRTDSIEKIVVTMMDAPMIRDQQAEESRRLPRTHEDADHSFTFLPVVAMVDGDVGERQFEHERWMTPQIRGLIEKVDLRVSRELGLKAPGSMPCHIRVMLAGGETLEAECLYPPGHTFTDRGLDEGVVEWKFRRCAEGALSNGVIDQIIGALGAANGAKTPADVAALLC